MYLLESNGRTGTTGIKVDLKSKHTFRNIELRQQRKYLRKTRFNKADFGLPIVVPYIKINNCIVYLYRHNL